MMKRLLLSAVLALTLGLFLHGQQLAQYSMPWLDPVQFNPAYAGLDNSLSVTGSFRTQWTGLEGQPSGQRLSAHMPIYYLSSGFGIEVERDELGARRLSRFGASYNYQLVTSTAVWSVGLSARMTQLSLDGSILRTANGIYEDPNAIIHNDDLLPTTAVDNSTLSLSAGIFYQAEKLEGGVSVRNLNQPVLGFSGLDYQLGQQYHAYLRMKFDVVRNWQLAPVFFAASDGVQTQLSLGATMQYNQNIFVGATYRGYNANTSDAIAIMGGLNLSDKISLAYAYDLTLSELRSVQDGSHEITIKYNLRTRIGAGVPPPIIYYPRAKE